MNTASDQKTCPGRMVIDQRLNLLPREDLDIGLTRLGESRTGRAGQGYQEKRLD
jgi:hypothetical protein